MAQVKALLIDEMKDLLHAENQILTALPKMAGAAKTAKLKEAFQKHLEQTQGQVERLKEAFELLGSKAEATPCKGMQGIIQEGDDTIKEAGGKDQITSDLALIDAAQKVEHYEIAGYGNARTLALQIDEREVARLFEQTLGEEESADHILTEISKPLLHQARTEELTGAKGTRGTASSGSARYAS
ncbi:MAG TPA: ferritin-like domain-containing protein [Bryobacteraceae bacterium]|nr:ferritin-like domain-containing protein [Bryobacteraceae bacterium]